MPLYPAPPDQRFAYDIDGTVVLVNGVVESSGVVTSLNDESDSVALTGVDGTITFLFPATRTIAGWFMGMTASDTGYYGIAWSTDTTDGINGTWHDGGSRNFANNSGFPLRPSFRIDGSAPVTPLTQGWSGGASMPWSSSFQVKAVRFIVGPTAWIGLGLGAGAVVDIRSIHLYGSANPSGSTGQFNITGATIDRAVLSRKDSYLPSAKTLSVSGGGIVTNLKITPEVLTEPSGRTLTEQLFVHRANGAVTFVAQVGPQTFDFSSQVGITTLVALAPDADLGGPWCFRVRVDGDGKRSHAVYYYVDEVNALEPTYPMITRVAPNTGLIAGVSTVTVIARGVGATQAERSAVLKLVGTGVSSDYDSGPLTPLSWTVISADGNAYNASRLISGTVCDPDHVTITFVVPSDAIGLTADVEIDIAGTDLGYAPTYTADIELTISATSYLSGAAAATNTSAKGVVVLRQPADPVAFDPTDFGYDPAELLDTSLYPPTPIIQRHFRREHAPYAVVDGIAVDPPILGALSKSVAFARSWSSTEHLGDELALGLMGAFARWLPLSADITLALNWWPHFGGDGSKHFAFSPLGLTVPFIDPSYDYYARNEELKTTQAMVLDGTSWLTFNGPASQGGFTWVIVAVLRHPANRSSYDVIASPSAATDPDRATDATLRYDNGTVSSFGGAKLSSKVLQPPIYKGRSRPVILAWAEGFKGGTLGVIDALGRHWQDYNNRNEVGYDLRMKLGQNGSTDDVSYAAEMDVLDVMYWDVRHTRVALGPVISALDGVYGVTGR